MTVIQDKKKEYMLPALSVLVTFLMLLLVFMAAGLYPFGNRMLVFSDSHSQYTAFWSYFTDVLRGERELYYAFGRTLGGSMLALLAYYAISPFNVIFLLFDRSMLPLAIHVIAILKLCCCSLTMAVYLRYVSGLKKHSLIFTTAYALTAYTVSYLWCLMWIDSVIFLPLMALGIRKLCAGEAPWLYLCSLAAAIICSFYTGFMLCVFSVMYYLYLLLTGEGRLKSIPSYTAASLAAGGLSAVVLLPAMLSIQDGKRVGFISLLKNYTYEGSLELLMKLMPQRAAEHDRLVKYVLLAMLAAAALIALAALIICLSKKLSPRAKIIGFVLCCVLLFSLLSVFEPGTPFVQKLLVGFTNFDEMEDGMPGIYSGLLCFVLCLYYFMSKDLSLREKLGAALVLLVFALSFRFYLPNLVWHGFTENNCFNYRYSFIFSFFVICLAERAWSDRAGFGPVHTVLISAAAAVIILIGRNTHPKLAEDWEYLLIFLAILCFCLLLSFGKEKKPAMLALALLFAASSFYVPVKSFSAYTEKTDFEGYRQSVLHRQSQLQQLPREGEELYRMNFASSLNDPLRHGYNGISHFSSTEDGFVVSFLDSIGFAASGNIWADGSQGRTAACDSLLGVRYLDDANYPAEELADGLYQNPNALPIAFMADEAVLGEYVPSENVFENIDYIFGAICPELGRNIYTPQTAVDISTAGLLKSGENSYLAEESAGEREIKLSFAAESTDPLWFFLTDSSSWGGTLYINGEYLADFSHAYRWRCVCLGSFAVGERLELSFKLSAEPGEELSCVPLLYYEDNAVIAEYCSAIKARETSCLSSADGHMEIRLDSDKAGVLLCTVPTDRSWDIRLDGEELEYKTAFGVFMAIPTEAGEHELVMEFRPAGLKAGILISALSLCAVLGWALLRKRSRRA